MIALLDLAADADAAADGAGGVQIHVDITQLPIAPPVGGLATTGVDLPVLLILAAVLLIVAGTAIVVRRSRRPS
jgi:hypothetical protein